MSAFLLHLLGRHRWVFYDAAMAFSSNPPPRFVNWRGQVVDLHDLAQLQGADGPAQPAEKPAPAPAADAIALTPEDLETVFDALCLFGAPSGSGRLQLFMQLLQRHTHLGSAFTRLDLRAALAQLVAARRLTINIANQHEVPTAALHQALPRVLLQSHQCPMPAWQAWAKASAEVSGAKADVPRARLTRREESPALARLVLYSGGSVADYQHARERVMGSAREPEVLAQGLCTPFMPEAWAAVPAATRHAVLHDLTQAYHLGGALFQPLLRALLQEVQTAPAAVPPPLRGIAAEHGLLSGQTAATARALHGLQGLQADILRSALQARQGQWAPAATAFAAVLKDVARELRIKRGFAAPLVSMWYVYALMAQPQPAQWTVAHKFCVAESGSRTPPPDSGWGLLAHALAVRLGDTPLLTAVLQAPRHSWEMNSGLDNAHRLLLAAWLGVESPGWTPAAMQQTNDYLHSGGLLSLQALVRVAARRLGLSWPAADAEGNANANSETAAGAPDDGWAETFFGTPREAWREALAAIEALGESAASKPAARSAGKLQWRMVVDGHGRVVNITPFEQTTGARGLSKPKAVPLSRLKKADNLDPLDAAVARCITASSWAPSKLHLDTQAAAVALVGHPNLVLDDAPQQPVDLREGLPQLEMQRQRMADGVERFVFNLLDPLAAPPKPHNPDQRDDDEDDFARYGPRPTISSIDKKNSLRVVRDAPDRARLIRINPAQRRVAELVAKEWAVPVEAKAELEGALRVLAGHFQLHSDATAGQEVAAEPRLRALLSPQGDGLQLRLLVQPFGSFGPAALPGQGRARVLMLHEGLNLATQRDLAAEQQHLADVLQALPQLTGLETADSTWALDDPEGALAVLERLPQLSAISGIDWPRGKPVRIQGASTQALQVTVKSGADWLGLSGELQLEEGRVISLQKTADAGACIAARPLPGAGRRPIPGADRTTETPTGRTAGTGANRRRRAEAARRSRPLAERRAGRRQPERRQSLETASAAPGRRGRPAARCARRAASPAAWLPTGTVMPGWCAWRTPAWAPAWPTTWAWVKRCRRWRC